MRTLPAGWPDPLQPAQTVPQVYLHVIDSTWPPASGDMPAGYAKVGQWDISRDLVGSALPGQIKGASGFAVSTGKCVIPQPPGGMLAPWRPSAQRTPTSGACELIASYDGPTGATAFVLGRFRLAPMSGKASEPFLTINLVEDLIRLNQPHNLDSGVTYPLNALSDFIEQSATALSYSTDIDPIAGMYYCSYFSGQTTVRAAWQAIAAASLSAIWLSLDGTTVVGRSAAYLAGEGTIVDTIDAITQLEDVEWTIDPTEAPDRIELSYKKAFRTLEPVTIWTAKKGAKIAAGEKLTFTIDPEFPVGSYYPSFGTYVNTAPDGSDIDDYLIPVDITFISSGRLSIEFTNDTGLDIYLIDSAGTRTTIQTIDSAPMSDPITLTWGVDATEATNTLTIDLGLNVQNDADAAAVLDTILSRISRPSPLSDIKVVPHLGREIGDLGWLNFPEGGLSTKTITTSIKLTGSPGQITQTLSVAMLAPTIADFNAAWDAAMPGATIADFNAVWAGKTFDDFNANPLDT